MNDKVKLTEKLCLDNLNLLVTSLRLLNKKFQNIKRKIWDLMQVTKHNTSVSSLRSNLIIKK
jgi:hypothetical protein